MELEYIENNYTGAVDILMMIGKENYDVPEILEEGRDWGISKRVPLNSVPDSFVPYVSRLFGWHSEAIPMVMADAYTMVDLVSELIERGLMDASFEPDGFDWAPDGDLLPDDYVPPYILRVTCVIQKDKAARAELEAKYKIYWQGGVIFYTTLGEIQYVVKPGETDVPEECAGDSRIQAVRIGQYVGKDGTPLEVHGDDMDEQD